jgi:hypothetical protein
MEDFDPYEVPAVKSYAEKPVASPTLSLLIGVNEGNIEAADNEQKVTNPAAVAARRALVERQENIEIAKLAAQGFAVKGNVPGFEAALTDIQTLQYKGPEKQSFVDDTTEIAKATIERIMAQTGMSVDEVIAMADLRSRDMGVRAALEVATASLEERGPLNQFTRDVLGVTTVKDWSRISPVLNEFNALYGYSGNAALTFEQSAINTVEMLRSINVEDREKVIGVLRDKLATTIGQEDARRVFERLKDVTEGNAALEGVFGLVDWVGIAALAKGSLKAVLGASRAFKVARDIGKETEAAEDVAKMLVDGKSNLGLNSDEAVSASLNVNLLSPQVAGVSSKVQLNLSSRIKNLIDDLEGALYTGGAKVEELMATKSRLENLYTSKVNTSIVYSNISTDINKGRINLDILYGNRTGTAFRTAEEALDYYKNLKRGDLEVVPAAVDNSSRIDELATTIKTLTSDINIASKKKSVLPEQFAKDITSNQQPAFDVINTVFNKLQANEQLNDGLEATLGRIIYRSKTPEEAASLVQKMVPEDIGRKLRQLEDAVAEHISLSTTPPKPGFYLRQRLDVPVFLKDIGKISADQLNKTSWLFGKLSPRLGTAKDVYTGAFLSQLKRDKYAKAMAEFVEESFNKLDAGETERVVEAIAKTEKLKRDMTVSELATMGIAADKEVEAYYAYRTARNISWFVKEKHMHDQLFAQGMQNILVSLGEEGLAGAAKMLDISEVVGKRVFVPERNAFTTVTQENLKEFSGMVPYKYVKGQKLSSHASEITTILVDPNKATRGDLMSVVGRTEGAYSRIYVEPYFVKVKVKRLIDDTSQDVQFAFRTAGSEADARKYVDGFQRIVTRSDSGETLSVDDIIKELGSYEENAEELLNRINNGDFRNAKITYNFDRTEGNYFSNVIGTGRVDADGGRLFWSGRSEDGLKSISTGSTENVTMGPLASMSAEVNNTARFAALSEWRANEIQRWYNTFEDVIDDSDKLGNATAEEIFFRVANRAEFATRADPKIRQMLAHKDLILAQLGVRTSDELKVQHAMNSLLGSRMLDRPALAHVNEWLRNADLPQYFKSVNSKLMLGLFSPAQLFVQANGALLAVTLSPKHGLKSFYTAVGVMRALTSNNKAVRSKFYAMHKLNKSGGVSEGDFMRIASAVERTGLVSNIGASSIYTGGDEALSMFARKRQAFNKNQMMFFNTGEEYTRVAAFDIARREFIEANPKAVWDEAANLNVIMARADDLTLNMTRANEARWSQGWAGLPAQFLQHPIRLGSSMLAAAIGKGNQITTKEALQIAIGSLLLYGINNNGVPDFAEEFLGRELNDKLSEEQKQYLTQGVLSGVLYSITDTLGAEPVSIALGTRLSSMQWYEDMYDAFFNLFKDGQFDFGAIWGPTGSTIANVMELPAIMRRLATKEEITFGDFTRTISESIGTLASSWRGVDKAYWAYHADGVLRNKRGDATAVLNTGEMIAQALGFSSTETFESSYVYKINREYSRIMDRYANDFVYFQRMSMKANLAGDSKAEAENALAAAVLLAALPAADQRAILSRARERTSYDTVLHEFMDKWYSNLSSRSNVPLMVNSVTGE